MISRDKTYKYGASIEIPVDYPTTPSQFKLRDMKENEDIISKLSEEIMAKMEKNDLRAIESLRPTDQTFLKSGEPLQPIFSAVRMNFISTMMSIAIGTCN